IQDDGKIVAVGTSLQQPGGGKTLNLNFALARYNSDGSPDINFGKKGQVLTDFGGSGAVALSMTLQGDGKIAAAGEAYQGASGNQFALARYNSDGSLDKGFGNSGLAVTDFGGISQAVGVAIQADGNIFAAGTASETGTGFDFALARYIGTSTSQSIVPIIT